MKSIKVLFALFVAVGLAGSVPAANAKKHHKSHSMSMKKGAASGDTSSEGNVGPGTTNNGSMPSK